jgi:hypothetical protein
MENLFLPDNFDTFYYQTFLRRYDTSFITLWDGLRKAYVDEIQVPYQNKSLKIEILKAFLKKHRVLYRSIGRFDIIKTRTFWEFFFKRNPLRHWKWMYKEEQKWNPFYNILLNASEFSYLDHEKYCLNCFPYGQRAKVTTLSLIKNIPYTKDESGKKIALSPILKESWLNNFKEISDITSYIVNFYLLDFTERGDVFETKELALLQKILLYPICNVSEIETYFMLVYDS